MFCFAGRSFTFFGYFYYCHVPSFQGICRILIRKLSFKHFFFVILIFFLFKHVCARQGPNPCTTSLAPTFLSFVLTFSFEEIVSPVFYLIVPGLLVMHAVRGKQEAQETANTLMTG